MGELAPITRPPISPLWAFPINQCNRCGQLSTSRVLAETEVYVAATTHKWTALQMVTIARISVNQLEGGHSCMASHVSTEVSTSPATLDTHFEVSSTIRGRAGSSHCEALGHSFHEAHHDHSFFGNPNSVFIKYFKLLFHNTSLLHMVGTQHNQVRMLI